MLDDLARRDTSTPGQVMEFRVWTELIQQSRGALHVFLPLLDRGLDAVVHRLTDGEYIPLQVKCKREAPNGFVEIGIPATELVDERALIIAGLLTDDGLGRMLLVVDEATFKARASRSPVHGEDIYTASFSADSLKSHWRPYLVRREQLAKRLLGSALPRALFESVDETAGKPIDRYSRWLGFLGEAEVIRRLAENTDLDMFRPFPDVELVEVLVRNSTDGRFLGLQVKVAVPNDTYGAARIAIRKATFMPAASTFVVALAWLPDRGRFADECLVVPTERLTKIALDGGTHWMLNFHPHSQERGRLDPYRRPLSSLAGFPDDSLSPE